MKELGAWRKLYKEDLGSIILEMKDMLQCPAVIFLTGDLGVGKTTFAKTFIEKYERKESLNNPSPTYSLVNETAHTAHADLYRLESEGEIVHLELPLYLDNKDFFFVEWGRKFLSQIRREIPEYFYQYELKLEWGPKPLADKNNRIYRNLFLYSMK